MTRSIRLQETNAVARAPMTFGVFATCDPRVDEASRTRSRNIVGMVADAVAADVKMPGGAAARVVWSPVLVDGERGADIVAQQFREAGVQAIICAPDTWAFPQLGLISLIQQFPRDLPLNLTCGNSGPKPGVVFTHAASGAISQYGRLVHINVGNWPDTGLEPADERGDEEGARGLGLRGAGGAVAQGPPRGRSGATTRWAWRPRSRT